MIKFLINTLGITDVNEESGLFIFISFSARTDAAFLCIGLFIAQLLLLLAYKLINKYLLKTTVER